MSHYPRLDTSGSSSTAFLQSGWQHQRLPDSSYTSSKGTLSEKYSLSADPQLWGSNLSPNHVEPDDALHNPDVLDGKIVDRTSLSLSSRGIANAGCLIIICGALLTLFLGYPVISYMKTLASSSSSTLLVNSTGQVASIGNFGLIDLDTPADAYTFTSLYDGTELQLVFSDEFETEGRTFYEGEDPYWEAVDLHYWQTNNMEWYDPAAVTTANGSLVITLEEKSTHGLDYQGGLVSSWNKFCFTGGLVVTSVSLPGINNVQGLWPAVWTMGVLGRAGYGASLDGTWYSYDACDVGTAPNQTVNGLPLAATTSGTTYAPYNGELSYLGGQRLSRCTCAGESHPGPIHEDGTYVGRSAPEIDIFEAQVSNSRGQVSQSGQWAPFNEAYNWLNTTDNLIIPNATASIMNTYLGGAFQQSTSVVTDTNQLCYELIDDCFSVYGFEYKSGFDNAYISWIADNKLAWTLKVAGLGADSAVEISARPIPQEPLYILANLGMSTNFGTVDLDHLTFPTHMRIDYIRVYQNPDSINIGCDPTDFPTSDYINTYIDAYSNPNLTTWVDDYGQKIPKNSLIDTC
ncbi:glycoside hydrolase family 16 protein [Mycena vulgaris]|nr:glycoside hydrolase family 16 protein [Mycena vulgaris]